MNNESEIVQAGPVLSQRLDEVDFLYLRQNKRAPAEAVVLSSHSDEWIADYRDRRRYLNDPVALAARCVYPPLTGRIARVPMSGCARQPE